MDIPVNQNSNRVTINDCSLAR